jgi:hypothetical protein
LPYYGDPALAAGSFRPGKPRPDLDCLGVGNLDRRPGDDFLAFAFFARAASNGAIAGAINLKL